MATFNTSVSLSRHRASVVHISKTTNSTDRVGVCLDEGQSGKLALYRSQNTELHQCFRFRICLAERHRERMKLKAIDGEK